MSFHHAQYLTVSSSQLFVEVFGESHLPPLFLLHGFPFTGASWQNNIPYLSQYFRVIVPDFRGLGKSELGVSAITMDTLADDIYHIANQLNITQANFLGLSMGGYVLFRLNDLYPNLISSNIFCNTKAIGDNNQTKIKRYESIKLIQAGKYTDFINGSLPSLLSKDGLQKNSNIILDIMEEQNPTTVNLLLLALSARLDSTETLSKINKPTLVIGSSEDVISPKLEMESMANQITNARFACIQNAGHLSNYEQPETFNLLVTDFLLSV